MSLELDKLKELFDLDRLLLFSAVEQKFEWARWRKELPYLQFPADWQIRIIPPFASAIIRFVVRTEKMPEDKQISIYFDGYESLGYYGEPYWEVYPVTDEDSDEDTIARFAMNDTASLLKCISEAIQMRELK